MGYPGENLKEGEIVKGKVVNIEDYGAFLEIMPGVEGLVHERNLMGQYPDQRQRILQTGR